jgi:hypothetical protein
MLAPISLMGVMLARCHPHVCAYARSGECGRQFSGRSERSPANRGVRMASQNGDWGYDRMAQGNRVNDLSCDEACKEVIVPAGGFTF